MKKYVLSFLFLICGQCLFAQDVIITKDGEPKKVWGLEMGSSAVYFRETEDPDAPIKRINKSELLLIKYKDGRKEIIGTDSESNQNNNNLISPQAQSADDPVSNMSAYNNIRNNNVVFNGTPSKDISNMLLCIYMPKQDAILADKNMELSFRSEAVGYFNGNKDCPNPHDVNLYILIRNKTSKTLYLDLGNCFFISGASAFPFYIPTATSNTSGRTTGVGVNLGGVSGALGIGGSFGKLASGISIGSSKSHFTTTTVFSQRVIAVPPMTVKTLDPVSLFPKDAEILTDDLKYAGTYGPLSMYFPKTDMLKIGEERNYDESNSLAPFGTMITYSIDEELTESHRLSASFFLQKIIGTKAAHKLDQKFFDVKSVTPNFRDVVHFYARQRKK